MALAQRIYKHTDKPMTWTRAIILGTLIYALAIVLLGQVPSWIIYKFDQYIAELIDFSKNIPGVGEEGLNSIQIRWARDVVANTMQNVFLITMVASAYIWQEKKRKRTGSKGLSDPVKGYMSGK